MKTLKSSLNFETIVNFLVRKLIWLVSFQIVWVAISSPDLAEEKGNTPVVSFEVAWRVMMTMTVMVAIYTPALPCRKKDKKHPLSHL